MAAPFSLRNSVKILGEKGYDIIGIHPGIPTAYSKKKRHCIFSDTKDGNVLVLLRQSSVATFYLERINQL